jgi:ankyrin repeat protein
MAEIHYRGVEDFFPVANPIFGVCTLGFCHILEDWWTLDVDISQVNGSGLDLLSIAAKNHHQHLCKKLISLGADVNRVLGDGYSSVLYDATQRFDTDMVKFLLDNKADPNLRLKRTILCMSTGTHGRSLTITRALLEAGADPNAVCEECKFGSPLECAASCNKYNTAELLIQYKANINLCTRCGYCGTPLAAAALGGSIELVRLLIEHGAEMNAPLECGSFGSALAAAAFRGSIEVPRLLIDHGADVNALLQRGHYGSALAVAANRGSIEVSRLLIEHGAAVNALLECGKYGSALAAAALGGSIEIGRLLIEHGADANALLECGLYGSALAAAAYRGFIEFTRLLIEHGANVNATLNYGQYGSALAAAAHGQGEMIVVRYLIEEASADPSILSKNPPSIPPPEADPGFYKRYRCGRYLKQNGYVVDEDVLRKVGLWPME